MAREEVHVRTSLLVTALDPTRDRPSYGRVYGVCDHINFTPLSRYLHLFLNTNGEVFTVSRIDQTDRLVELYTELQSAARCRQYQRRCRRRNSTSSIFAPIPQHQRRVFTVSRIDQTDRLVELYTEPQSAPRCHQYQRRCRRRSPPILHLYSAPTVSVHSV